MSSRRSQEKRWTFITVELARQKAPGFVGWFETPPSGFRPVPNPPAVGAKEHPGSWRLHHTLLLGLSGRTGCRRTAMWQ